MLLKINQRTKISEVQDAFSKMFPFLKLEFFKRPHGEGETSPPEDKLRRGRRTGNADEHSKEGILRVVPRMTVAELEQGFQDCLGLSVQVFRKSGKNWIQTCATDSWTLAKENETGKEITEMSAAF